MSYFATALKSALAESGTTQRSVADGSGISAGTVSKLANGAIDCSPDHLASLCNFFRPHPQLALNLVVARCKDIVPQDFREVFDDLSWRVAEDQSPYKGGDSAWEKTINTLREKGLYNDDLRQTCIFLAEVAQ